jgi:hypothetical protein
MVNTCVVYGCTHRSTDGDSDLCNFATSKETLWHVFKNSITIYNDNVT